MNEDLNAEVLVTHWPRALFDKKLSRPHYINIQPSDQIPVDVLNDNLKQRTPHFQWPW